MKALSRLLVFIFLAGAFTRVSASEFAKQLPAGGLVYVEVRNTEEYQERFAKFPALQELTDFDWKSLVLQLYQLTIENTEDASAEDKTPSVAEVDEFISSIQDKWDELNSHLTGEFAFSVGDFQKTFDVFSENVELREQLELVSRELDEDELTVEQIVEQEKRLAEEERLDEREVASVFGELLLWARIKEAEGQDGKLESWLIESMTPDAEDDYTLTQQEWKGTALHIISSLGEEEGIIFNWAIKDGFWIIAFTTDALKKTLDDFGAAPEDVLANLPAFKEAVEFVGPFDSFFYIDFSPLDQLLRKGLEKMPTDETGMIPQAEKILEWFGIDALLPLVSANRLNEKGVSSRGRMGFSRETAFSRILIDPNAGAAEVPSFIHTDFNSFSSFDWNIGNGWSRLETEIMGLSPQAAAGMGLGRMLASGQLGFDLKLQFLDHLEGNTLYVQTFDPDVIEKIMAAAKNGDLAMAMQVQMEHPTGGQNYLVGFKMKNQEAIEEALGRLMNRFHPDGAPEPIDFEGQAIHYPIPSEVQAGKFQKMLSYTYLDGYLLLAIGDDKLLQKAIQASKDPFLQLVNVEEFKALRANLSPDAGTLEYSNRKQQENAMKMVQSSLSMLQAENPDLVLPDLTSLVGFIKQSMSSSVRKGLVYEIEGFMEFSPAE